jgi:hypothetical protein
LRPWLPAGIVTPVAAFDAGALLLAFAPKTPKKIPNYDAIGLSPTAGWLVLAAAIGLALFLIGHKDRVRRLLFRMDDPRPMALFRITFGIVTLCNVNGLWEHFDYLFTDEGLFPTEVARHVRARAQFAGFGDGVARGEPTGFFDFAAVVEWLKGPNYSLLLFWDTPTAFWIHLTAWWFFMTCFIVGFQTRWTKWVAWFLFHSIILRNLVFWEGTENVFRTFFFYLCLARCGQAYSVDNWLRCRRLRKQGRLSERGDAPSDAHPKGREAIYRLIPFWPRFLTIVQIGAIYLSTGVVKNGPVWMRGDSFYYAFNLDHFYRIPPQALSAYLGTSFFKINTIITHYWECFFAVVIIGLVLRWLRREQVPDPPRWRLRLANFGLALFAATFIGLVVWVYPVHYNAPKSGVPTIETIQWIVGVGSVVGTGLLIWFYRSIRDRPRLVTIRGHEFTIDIEWICRWILGRRWWLGLGVIFHGHLIFLMNIGWFSPALLCGYFAFLNGSEVSRVGARMGRVLARLKIPMPKRIFTDEPTIAGEDQTLPHHRRDGIGLPLAAVFTGLALAVLGVVRHVQSSPNVWAAIGKVAGKHKRVMEVSDSLIAQHPQASWGWFGLAIGLMLLAVTFRRIRGWETRAWAYPLIFAVVGVNSVLHEQDVFSMRWSGVAVVLIVFVASRGKAARDDAPLPVVDGATGRPVMPWAYGPLGRVMAGMLFFYHCVGVGIWLLPDKWCLNTFRIEARQPFQWWLQTSQTTQGWSMFAPNPPRRNLFMRVVVTDQEGGSYDLNTDIYACFQDDVDPEICQSVQPVPWIWYSRRGKMNRRIAGGEGGKGVWYQKWHGRWLCRQWAREHDGVMPKKVDIIKVTYSIPTPEYVWRNGPYDPKARFHEHGKQEKEHTTRCANEVEAQLPNDVRERYGFEPLPKSDIKPYLRKRCKKWEDELKKKARERGEEVADDDPRFEVCIKDDETAAR